MSRVRVCSAVLLVAAGSAHADPPRKLTAGERQALEAKWVERSTAGVKAYQAFQLEEAGKNWTAAVEVCRQLYPENEYPGGHSVLATSLMGLATVYRVQARYADAEPLARDAVAMYRRVHPPDHPTVATGLGNLAAVYRDQGKWAAAEALLAEALAMRRRLFPGDHPDVADGLTNLALAYKDQGRPAAAEPLLEDALAMRRRVFPKDHPDVAAALLNVAGVRAARGKPAAAEPPLTDAVAMYRRLFPGDHPHVAGAVDRLASLYHEQGKLGAAEPLYRDALAMRRRLFPGDDPRVAAGLNNLALLYRDQGKFGAAEPLYRDALDMCRRPRRSDHPDVATGLTNLAGLHQARGDPAAAEPLHRDALAMGRRLLAEYAGRASEGHALTLLASLPLGRDAYLSAVGSVRPRPARAYPEVWAAKGQVARVYEGRQQSARAAATDPVAARLLADLTAARRRRAELLLAPAVADPATRRKREDDLEALDAAVAGLAAAVRPRLPAVARAEKLAAADPADLRKVLPAGTAVVDFLRYTEFGFDPAKPGRAGETRTPTYLAFVLTAGAVVWVDLGPAEPVERAVRLWREAITGPAKEVAADLPAAVRRLVWEKVRKELPAGTTAVYVCPDADLCRVPWAALPGDRPGTVLLEDFAVATIPHAPFLLDKLWPPDPVKNPPAGALVVGGVGYDADPPGFWAAAAGASRAGGGPLLREGDRAGWAALPNTAREAAGVAAAAERRKLPATQLGGDRATPAAVLAGLPTARVAHLATHGFFADASFRGPFRLDEKDYETSRLGERVGRAANSPLVMTGLVLAGANRPAAPGRGVVTGEALVDLDLSGLGLAVLSACETGLGDVAGGEGTFGLQRAFHLAGCRDVVASLWKVDDAATAALMAAFYRHLWEQNRPPIEALRQAQLEVYRNPGAIPELAAGLRGKFEVVPGTGGGVPPPAPGSGGKAHPRLWAAFTLSGPGR